MSITEESKTETELVSKSVLVGKRLLVVDDHKNIRLALKMTLETEGAIVEEASGYMEALSKLEAVNGVIQNKEFHAILTDIRMPDGSGMDILKMLSENSMADSVIMISGEGTVQDAFRATTLGAFDYIEKPFTPERILVSVSRCIAFNDMTEENKKLSEKARRGNIILGESNAVLSLVDQIKRVAPTNGRVLVVGESGTGKELVAREIHRLSNRSQEEIVKVNCAAIPASLIESELFGHEKGAFTGAHKERKGVFERADKGTLFLDEIGELELAMQAKLLRALQNGEIIRVGAEKPLIVDVRLIAATNRDLKEMVDEGTFREDLYYRLNVIALQAPPLRERGNDKIILADQFLSEACEEHSLGKRYFSDQAKQQLNSYAWPGNIRQLKNLVERVAILSENEEIEEIEFLVSELESSKLVVNSPRGTDPDVFFFESHKTSWQEFHEKAGKEYIKFVLGEVKGNVSEAARVLCLERAYLHRLMKKLGVQREVVVGNK